MAKDAIDYQEENYDITLILLTLFIAALVF